MIPDPEQIDPANILREVIKRERRAQQGRSADIEHYRNEIKALLDQNALAEIAIQRYEKAVEVLQRSGS